MRKSLFFTTVVSSLLFFSCETEIDKDAEYQDMTIVYGLLDPDDTSHYIKINKGFIGEGDANDLASNASNYDYADGEISVKLDEYNSAGVFVKSYSLARTVNDIPKEDGVFDSSTNVLYRFDEANLSTSNTFKLLIYNSSLDKEITAETDIVQAVGMNTFNQLKFRNSAGTYLAETFYITPSSNLGRLKADLIFNYTEFYTNTTDSVEKFVRIPMGEELATNLQGNNIEFTLNGDVFFSTISGAIPATTPNILKRRVNNSKVDLTLAGIDLSTYMTINDPSTGTSQTKPDFTNITNGLGILSSRTSDLINSNVPDLNEPGYDGRVNLGEHTLKKLITMGREFCTTVSAGTPSSTPQNLCN